MLGCQDFCGHYDWTFAYLRQNFGQQSAIDLWEFAIGVESQQHYTDAANAAGLKGLYDTWVTTGEDEKCDWTFTLDESRNVLRMDMRQCPSKGFLLSNDLVNDEDYCDHCMGWMGPLLAKSGYIVTGHEHNHHGQCWAELSDPTKPSQSPESYPDITKDPRWHSGHLDRWKDNVKLPVLSHVSTQVDTCDVLAEWFSKVDELLVLGRGPSAADARERVCDARTGVIVADPTYATRDVFEGEPLAVLMGDRPSAEMLTACAKRFHATAPEHRPLLMCAYLPRASWPAWEAHGLPRPISIMPLILRADVYHHDPNRPYPTTGTLMVMLAAALDKTATARGMDLYQTPDQTPANIGESVTPHQPLPAPHGFEEELVHLRRALKHAQGRLTLIGQATRWL